MQKIIPFSKGGREKRWGSQGQRKLLSAQIKCRGQKISFYFYWQKNIFLGLSPSLGKGVNRPIALKFDFLPFSRFGHSLFFFSLHFVHKKVHFLVRARICVNVGKNGSRSFLQFGKPSLQSINLSLSQRNCCLMICRLFSKMKGNCTGESTFHNSFLKWRKIYFLNGQKKSRSVWKTWFYVLGKYNSIHEQTHIYGNSFFRVKKCFRLPNSVSVRQSALQDR